jgi:filamentous hemagglutinin family protein
MTRYILCDFMQQLFNLKLARWLATSGVLALGGGLFPVAFSGNSALAQITPDTTLGNENSTVTSTGAVDSINGGATRGANLFHSFGELNVEEGRAAYFNNPAGIENILSRVTGGNPSQILGRLGVLGNANLFLINPKGIIFGRNASLDVRGSFVGTTANSVRLGETGLFSASEPQTSNLLTIAPSALFFNAVNQQAIVNQSRSLSLSNPIAPGGLQVPTDRTLALVGGDILLDRGNLTVAGGRIELGSVAGAGEVGLSQQGNRWILGYDAIARFRNIKLENGAVVNAGKRGGGDIQIQTANLLVRDGARITNRPSEGGEAGGDLIVKASDSVELSGILQTNDDILPGGLFAGSELRGGNSGNLTLSTQKLTVRDGAAISAAAFNGRNGGILTINASDSVDLGGWETGRDPVKGREELFVSNLATGSTAIGSFTSGEAGNLEINTERLVIQDGALIVTVALDSQRRDSIINASESVVLSGTSGPIFLGENPEPIEIPSAVFADSIVFFNRAAAQKPGSLEINTRSLLIEKGAVISASTFGLAQGGNLTVNASEVVQLDGASSSGFHSGLYAQSFATGTGGNLKINTRELALSDRARIKVAAGKTEEFGVSPEAIVKIFQFLLPDLNLERFRQAIEVRQGTGDAGNLDITARSIRMYDRGELSASSNSGNGGNILLQGQGQQNLDLLLAGKNSQISTSAGTVGAGGDGGNINIDAQFIAATENSDITANAFEGSGGNINITAQSIFGLQYRDRLTSNSDINASSEFGVDGVVKIDTPDTDPSQGLVSLPVVPVDTQVSQACTPSGNQAQSEFVVTGRGGLPQNPGDALNTDAVQVDLVTLNPQVAQPSTPSVSTNSTSSTQTPIVEAQGWMIDKHDNVILMANASTTAPHSSWQKTANCKS